ncbi:2-amino-4-hydroxy-6-hydroxymethyldihydropteridine diphosphokinase [Psychrosphaera aestuarii]|uniref:2-amino-4-hydroxy-6- hydroxymethyldihydropteridine diphosphokinase n=1 Tax=Psychrosphaera aestuarii TaxID=1266052 RepID=UPI001B32D03F|nr:2-amino-4-hydroxy-6-hydroxymethyldihydropteridine diphosphokinase [Psychrosphaera aestuarii]
MSELVYIGLGANLNNPYDTIRSAITALSTLADCEFVGQSKIYASKPMGPADQPDYVNAVVALKTSLSAHDIFSLTCQLEQAHGRTRNGEHWGPRTLDLDILLYGDNLINDDQLTVPHYGLKEREFVVFPMLDIDPLLVLPCGTALSDIAKTLAFNDMNAI